MAVPAPLATGPARVPAPAVPEREQGWARAETPAPAEGKLRLASKRAVEAPDVAVAP